MTLSFCGVFGAAFVGGILGIVTSDIEPLWLRRGAAIVFGGAAGCIMMLGASYLGLP